MSKIDVIRAWKDEDYRSSFSEAERAELPDNPAGLVELSETSLRDVAGGTTIFFGCTLGCTLTTVCPTLDNCISFITVCPSVQICLAD